MSSREHTKDVIDTDCMRNLAKNLSAPNSIYHVLCQSWIWGRNIITFSIKRIEMKQKCYHHFRYISDKSKWAFHILELTAENLAILIDFSMLGHFYISKGHVQFICLSLLQLRHLKTFFWFSTTKWYFSLFFHAW